MNWRPAPIVGGAYADETRPWSVQDTVNWLPVRTERPGTRTDWMLRSPPGLAVHHTPVAAAPVRGAHNAEGAFLAVIGTSLVRVNGNGTTTALGTIPGVQRVSMAHNQVAGGNQVAIANGTAGYVYSTATNALVQITDDGFPGAKVFDFCDGFFVFVEPGGRFWGWSDLAAGTSYSTIDRAEAESQPDKIKTLIVSRREVLVFGERSCDVFENVGTATGTFERKNGAELDIGCASEFAVARLDNTVYWLGHDGIVYRLAGYAPQRVSTGPIEQAISKLDISRAFATTWEDREHKVFYLTFQDGQTWGFDVASQEWHRRASDGLSRWRLNTLTRWNRQWYGGDFSSGRIYRLDWNVMSEAEFPMVSERTTAVLHANGNPVPVNGLQLMFDTGQPAPASMVQPEPTVDLSYSKNGGNTWSGWKQRSLGATGEFVKRAVFNRCGLAKQWVFKVRVSSPVKRDLMGASIR